MSHVLLVLPKPDWIQLSNVYLKFDKHMFTEAYTLQTIVGKLGKLTQNSKIHVIGHGSPTAPQHASVDDVAKALKASGMPDNGTKIRLDTCSSASNAVPQNFAQKLLATLKGQPYNFKTLTVEGTTGASITGFKEGREVVDPASIKAAGAVQNAVKIICYDEIEEATKLVSAGWNENLSSSDIRMLAFQVHLKSSEFFKLFRKYLVNLPKATAMGPVLLDKDTALYKQQYS